MSTADLPSAPVHAIVRPPETMDDPTRVARLLWLRAVFGEAILREEGLSIDPLADRMTEFFLPKGAYLYRRETISDSLFFIVEGAVRQEGEGYTLFRAGDVLGFVDAMIERPHLYTAEAVEDSIVLRLKLDDWLGFLEEHPLVLRGLLSSGNVSARPRPDLWGRDPEGLEALLAPVAPQARSSQLVRRLLAARCSPMFRRAGIQSLAQLVNSAEALKLEPGQSFQLTGPGYHLVVAGTVWARIGSPEDHESHEYPPGTIIGSTRLSVALTEIAEARAVTAAEVLWIHSESYFEVLEDHFDLAKSAMHYMALKVEESNRERSDDGSTSPAPTR